MLKTIRIIHSVLLATLATALVTTLAGCRLGGDVTNALSADSPSAAVNSPIIGSPVANPYYSTGNSVTIQGACTSGDSVYLSGPSYASTSCQNSTFSFVISQSTDGVYSYVITQNASGQSSSAPANFVWVRKTSVAPPALTYPAASPFLSGLPSLTIAGACENGDTVSLTGDGSGSVVCAGSRFSLALPKAADGDYNIGVQQTDPAGNVASISFVWKKHALGASPSAPQIQVGTTQYMTITGGSGSYTVSLTTNASGGSYNAATGIYTAGPLAAVTDVLTITDSLNTVQTVNIATLAGPADHFVFPTDSGNLQSTPVGQTPANTLKVQVTDRYGNGIGFTPFLVRTTIGDAQVLGDPLVTADVNGFGTFNVRMGYTTPVNGIHVSPLNGSFNDDAHTGNGSATLTEYATSAGTGKLGSSFPTGANPGAFVVADFNGDGFSDMAVVNVDDPSVGIFMGKGNGIFKPMTKIIGLCSGPNSIASGDFNSDNKTDLILVCSGAGKYVVLYGNGDGTFQTPVLVSTGSSETTPMAITVADFDADGHADFAIVTNGGQNVAIRYGDGAGNFTAPVEYPVGQTPVAILAVKLNADSYPDLVVANSSDGTLSVFFSNGHSRTFTSQGTVGTGASPVSLASGAFNSHGYQDVVVVSNSESNVYLYINDGTGSLQSNAVLGVGSSPTWAATADFNGDGHLDVVVANNGDNSVLILSGDGNGNLVAGSAINVETGPVFVAASDVDRDSHQDIIVTAASNKVIQVLTNQGAGVFGYTAAVGNSPVAAVTADFTGDGIPDLAVVNQGLNNVTILKGKPIGFTSRSNGFFTPLSTLSTGPSPTAIAVADLNNDGFMDLVVASQTAGSVRIYLGNGDGTFQAFTTAGVGSSPSSITIQDFNGDGFKDIAVANSSSNKVSILINNKDGTFGTKSDFAVGNGPSAIVAADFNGDNLIDLAVANATDATVSILLGNGNGTFQAHADYIVGNGPSAIVAADFDNDGHIDLAVTDANDGNVSLLPGVGNGSFGTHADYSCGTSPAALSIGDFNGDGKPDLIVANGPALTMTVLFNSSGRFSVQSSLSTNVLTPSLVVGDWNKDGISDVVIIDGTDNLVQTWMGH